MEPDKLPSVGSMQSEDVQRILGLSHPGLGLAEILCHCQDEHHMAQVLMEWVKKNDIDRGDAEDVACYLEQQTARREYADLLNNYFGR